jgi:mono/diheme cytochrome c family protein
MKNERSRRRRIRLAVGIGATLSLGLLAPPLRAAAEEKKPAPIPESAMKEAKEIFAQRCSTCHGAGGKGDGAAAAALNPKPRDLTSAEWQKSVSDEHIEKIILGGGAAVGKSPMMPPNADLENKPDVVHALRQLVRDLGPGGAEKK